MRRCGVLLIVGSWLLSAGCGATSAAANGRSAESASVRSARDALARAEQDEATARRTSPAPAAVRWSHESRIAMAERSTGDARVALARARCGSDSNLERAATAYDAASRRLHDALQQCDAQQEDFEHLVNAPGYSAADEDEDEARADEAIAVATRAHAAWRTALDAVTSHCRE